MNRHALWNGIWNAWEELLQPWRYVIVIGASLALSLLGVAWAVHTGCPEDGGRGGAIATVFAFVIILIRPNHGLIWYKMARKRISPSLPDLERLHLEHDYLLQGLEMEAAGSARQNQALAVASIIAAIFWGFGDILVAHLLHRPSPCGF